MFKKGANISSKIENYESTENLEDIIKASDGIVVALGDLSCEISFGAVPSMQKTMVALCSYYNKPVIIVIQLVLSWLIIFNQQEQKFLMQFLKELMQ